MCRGPRGPSATRSMLKAARCVYAGKRFSRLIAGVYAAMPQLRDEDLPTVRQWCELEVIRRACFAALCQVSEKGSILSVVADGQEVQLRRLVHDHRQLCAAHLVYQRELMMTPAVRLQVQNKHGEQGYDLVAMMAQGD